MSAPPQSGPPLLLHVEGVTKRYGAFTAVDDLSLRVPAGRVFGLLGPNGAGKTTTMRMISGLIRPTAGRIVVDGLDVLAEPVEVKRRLGYVPDRPHLYDRLTALEHMRFVAGLYRLPGDAAALRALELLATFGLLERQDALVESFSHGMRQRLVMASALLHEPRLLIVDEPMVGLDPRGIRLLKAVLRDYAARGDRTVIFSTHTLGDAEEICDEVAIVHRGRVVALGPPRALASGQGGGAGLEDAFLALTAEAEASGDVEVE